MIRFPLVALAALLFALPASAQTDASVVPPDAPKWLSMAEAVTQAKADSSIVLVHTYAVWCGWCARFDQEVYTDDAVQAYIAENFAPTRVDLESQEVVPFFEHEASMAALGQAFGVAGTPTTVFVAPDGQLLTKLPGYTDASTFLSILHYVREGAYETETFQNYLNRINGTGVPALQQASPDIRPGG